MKGRKHTKEAKEKIRMSKLGKPSPVWKGGYKNKLKLNRERRVLKLNSFGSHTISEWENLKILYKFTCPCCKRKEQEIKLTEDHVIPLSKGGSDNIENIQPLCKNCNSRKSNNTIRYELDF